MAIQISAGGIVKTPGIGMVLAGLKLQYNNTGTPKVLAGSELLANGGSVTSTTNTNAAILTVTLNCSILDVTWMEADMRDDGQTGGYVTHGNITSEATSTFLSFKIGYFSNTGAAVTGANVNANSTVVGVALLVRNVGVTTGN